MKGNDAVIERLNLALQAELTAIVQYMVHAEMCENWGYERLSGYVKKQSIDEMRHAEALIERILFLDGAPKIGFSLGPKVGQTVKEQVENDLNLELGAVREYNTSARICIEAGDNASRELFERLVKDEEDHVDFLEAQLHLIKEMGIENYLSQQMHEQK